jgi:hypothetical protein
MDFARAAAWCCVAGSVTSVLVTWWPVSWQYAPGIIFGATISLFFLDDIWRPRRRMIGILKMLCFIGLSAVAYHIALVEAEWVLGTNGFADWGSYGSSSAMAAIFVACFVGSGVGAVILSAGMRIFFFKFDVVRGMFLFSLTVGAISSFIIVGFEMFGFMPQFLFPVWQFAAGGIIVYIHKIGEEENAAAVERKTPTPLMTPLKI